MIGIRDSLSVVALVKRFVPGEHDVGIRVGEIALRLLFRDGRRPGRGPFTRNVVIIIALLTGLALLGVFGLIDAFGLGQQR